MLKDIYIKSTLAYCKACGKPEQALIVSRDGSVYLDRLCPQNGKMSSIIARDYNWYMERTSFEQFFPSPKEKKPSINGCPNDCGLCEWHTNKTLLPIFSITNDCNLDCPKCFTYNRQDKKYYKSLDETKQILDNLTAKNDNIQFLDITGGEPSLHPNLFEILDLCKSYGISRVMMNTNGLKIADDETFAKKIKESGVQVVLSLDTLNPETSIQMYGVDLKQIKLRTLAMLEKYDIPTTLLAVAVKNLNENEIAEICKEYLKKDFVRSITIQNFAFTGKNGKDFTIKERLTMDDMERALIDSGVCKGDDFFPPSSYHPLCYSSAYYIVHGGFSIPLSRILPRELLSQMSKNSYILNPKNDFSKNFLDGVNNLWAEGESPLLIKALKSFIERAFPNDRSIDESERRSFLEKKIKMILIHPHMDEDNFDLERTSRCGDIVPDENGNFIPACAYNLIYRQKDERFWIDE